MCVKPYTCLALFLLVVGLGAQQAGPTFADEFDGAQLDLARWIPHDPFSGMAAGDLRLSGGQLHIGPGGALSTFGLFAQTYGRFEIRARGRGARFRLMPVPLGHLPAIDVFAASGTTISFAGHWGTEQTERSFGDSFPVDLSGAFHTVTLDWNSDRLQWSVDGKEKFQSAEGVPHQPMYLLLDVSGTGTVSFDVDYIRVYR